MYSVEPSSRRLNCTEVETGQRRKAPSPRCMIPFNSFIHGDVFHTWYNLRVWNLCQKSSRNLPILSLEFPFPYRWLKAFGASLQYFMSGYLTGFVYRLFNKSFLPVVWPSGTFYIHLHLLVHSGKSAKSTGSKELRVYRLDQGVTKRCRLSLLTNSALVIRVQMRGEGGSCGVSANEYSCAHHVTLSPNKLWRSTSIFKLWSWYSFIEAKEGQGHTPALHPYILYRLTLYSSLEKCFNRLWCTYCNAHLSSLSSDTSLSKQSKFLYTFCFLQHVLISTMFCYSCAHEFVVRIILVRTDGLMSTYVQ